MIIWNKLVDLAISAIFSTLSGTLGAKQLVVDSIHKILSMPSLSIYSFMPSIFVYISSPK